MARVGLYLYPNGNYPSQHQFISEPPVGWPTFAPVYDRDPRSVSGATWQDTITWTFDKFLYHDIAFWWQHVFAQGGVTQKRLVNGEIILYPAKYPCDICRVCWDVIDNKTGVIFQETATGLVSITQAEVSYFSEAWQFTLFRGDKYLNSLGQLEASTRGCGGG